MPTYLPDPTVLVALVLEEHEQHAAARTWVTTVPALAFCPTTQSALVRALTHLGEPAQSITAVLRGFLERPGSEFWPDSVSYTDVDIATARRSRDVTGAYLVALARARSGIVATLNEALASTAPDVVALVPHDRGTLSRA